MDYDQIAEKYGIYGADAITVWELGYKNVTKALEPLKEKRILDYGCGSGNFSRFLRDAEAKIIGVDPSKGMLDVAKRHSSEGIDYHQISEPKLNFIESNSLDGATLTFVLCTISTKEEIISIFREINRVLKKGAKLIILNSNWDKSNGRDFLSLKLLQENNLFSGKKIKVLLKSKKDLIVEDYHWSKEDYSSMLDRAGFKISSIQEPRANDDKHKWIDEKEYPPFLIIVAEK